MYSLSAKLQTNVLMVNRVLVAAVEAYNVIIVGQGTLSYNSRFPAVAPTSTSLYHT